MDVQSSLTGPAGELGDMLNKDINSYLTITGFGWLVNWLLNVPATG